MNKMSSEDPVFCAARGDSRQSDSAHGCGILWNIPADWSRWNIHCVYDQYDRVSHGIRIRPGRDKGELG